jgi:hypothetical protein
MAPVSERPELQQVNAAWCKAVDLKARPLGTYSDKNQGLINLLQAFEVASLEDLLRVCEEASRDDWCKGKTAGFGDTPRKRDVGCLSPKVLTRLLTAADERARKAAKVKARLEADIAEEQRLRERDDARPRAIRPVKQGQRPPSISSLLASTSVDMAPPRSATVQVTGRPVTAEEIDRALQAGGS